MEGEAKRVARDYFAALGRRDLDAARTHLAADMHGLADFDGAAAVMEYFASVFAAVPDWHMVDEATGRPRPPHVPVSAFNLDDAQARDSLRRLAALDLTVAWPAHGEPLRGDVRRELERAAAG